MYPLMSPKFPRYREFQDRTWREIVAAKPACIVVIGLQSSLLLDTQGDLRMLDQVGTMLDSHYQINAVMTLDTPKGKFFSRTKTPGFESLIQAEQFPIHVFGLRSAQPQDSVDKPESQGD